jgi:VanZ family protein
MSYGETLAQSTMEIRLFGVRLLDMHRLWCAALVALLVLLAFIGFWPSPVDQPVQGEIAGGLKVLHTRGVSESINYWTVEAAANVGLFVPLGIVASFAFPRKWPWQIAAFGLLVSGCIELGQQLFLHDRFASPVDLVTNTLGAVIGAVLAQTAFWGVKKKQAQRLAALSLSEK